MAIFSPARVRSTFLCSVLCLAPVAQSLCVAQPVLPRDMSPSQLADWATRQLLTPTLDGLKEQSSRDPQLETLLSRVRLHTLGTPHPHLGRNAAATTLDGQPALLVDLEFLAEAANVGSLAALGIMQNEHTDRLASATLQEYDREAARAKGGPTPDFVVDVDALPPPPALRDVAVRLGVEVALTTTAWVVLHEVAHHMLGHVKSEPASREDSREWERKADRWAYRRLYDLGYHLYFLEGFFQAREILEEIELKHGLAVPESESTHPLYATRRSDLTSDYDVDKATPARMLAFVGFGWNEKGEPELVEMLVPRFPDEDMQIVGTVTAGSASSNQVVDWTGNEGHIYGRSGEFSTEVTIHHPELMRTKVTVLNRHLRSGATQKVERMWIQTSLAHQRRLRLDAVPVSFVLENPMGTMMRQALRDAGVDSASGAVVVREFAAWMSALRRSLVRYAKGELTPDDFAKAMETTSDRLSARLRTLLGDKGSEEVGAALMANPMLLAMMEAMFKR